MTATLLIFGATGDLTRRYLMPAMADLAGHGSLPAEVDIVGAAREPLDDDAFRAHIADCCREAAGVELRNRVRYTRVDASEPADVARVVAGCAGPVFAYLALPPALFEPTLRGVIDAAPSGSRVAIEKPFGTDLAAAQRLNGLLRTRFNEDEIFRVDHFLGHATVQNLLGLRFANSIFEPLWDRRSIERVDIIWDETVALEGRAGYYDTTGALVDMVQNHLLQLLTLVALEPPHSLEEGDLRDRKMDVLRAVRRPAPIPFAARCVRARYTAGCVEGRELPAYVDEAGVDPDRQTETFVELELEVDNWRWAGVPFVVRTGKALGARVREIVVRFRPVPYLAYGQDEQPVANTLCFSLDPDTVRLAVNLNESDERFSLQAAELAHELAPARLQPYANVLRDLLTGDASLGVRGDEAEEAWRIIEPLQVAWKSGAVPLGEYPAGTLGELVVAGA